MVQIGLEKTTEDVDKKIPNTTGLAKMTDYGTKITEIENKIHSVTGLVTIAAQTTNATKIKNKIPGITDMAAKATLNTKAVPHRWNSPCYGEGAYPPRSSNQNASTRRAQLSV